MLRNIILNKAGRPLQRLCHAQSTQQPERYGYVLHNGQYRKIDKDNEGVGYVGQVKLPDPLKDSLELYYKEHPRRQIIKDGLKLSRHISNRGRPTQSTWMKYRQAVDAAESKEPRTRRKDGNLVAPFKLKDVSQEDIVPNTEQTTMCKEEDENYENENMEEDLANRKRRRKKAKQPLLKSYSMIRYGPREAAAYTACRLPSVYGSTYKALNEIKKRDPNYQPKTLLDFGSGTGMSVWAAHSIWKDNVKEYQCVDPSEDMNKTAEFLLRGTPDVNAPLKVPNVYFKRFLPLSNQVKYDIVIAAYTLSEMPFSKPRLQAIRSLWQKTNDFLVIIEPGNNEGFEIALQARNFILGTLKEEDPVQLEGMFGADADEGNISSNNDDVGHIFAPCTHELVCARTDINTRDHPCNFTQKVELSYAHQTTSLKKQSYYNERYSYIIFRKEKQVADNNKDDKAWARILKPIVTRKNHVICELCCKNGNIEQHVLTKKKDQYVYKAARNFLGWGDRMPLDELKRPQKVRSPPVCLKSKE